MNKRFALLILVLGLGCARSEYFDSNPGVLKSMPENLSFRALFVGDSFKTYNFFENRAQHPFWPDCAQFDEVNAWWCAEASLLVYVPDEPIVRAQLARAGFDDVVYFDKRGGIFGPDMQFLIAARKEFVLVSFRGSEPNLADWVTNAKFGLVPFGAGSVHRGFLAALEDACGKGGLEEELERLESEDPERPIWFCGHSLGGAVAVLAAAQWFEDDPAPLGGVYIFGAPRIGDENFASSVKYPVWRVVNDIDLVPTLPSFEDYADIGALMWIDPSGNMRSDNSRRSKTIVGRDVKYFGRKPRWTWLPEDVIDHSPLIYAILGYNEIQN